jgi:ferredoxin--NADP+ reductase
MIGMELEERPLMRAYSIASPSWDDELEFYSIIISNGALTSRLQHINVGDPLLMSAKPVGTLTLQGLRRGGRRLFMLSTGTGFAPFASLVRDAAVYEEFEEVYVTQTCRFAADLQYGQERVEDAKSCPLVGEDATKQLVYYGSVTREPHLHEGRITTLIETGQLFTDLGIPGLDPATDRVMICGSIEMLNDTQTLLEGLGFDRGSNARPGDYVWERAFTG